MLHVLCWEIVLGFVWVNMHNISSVHLLMSFFCSFRLLRSSLVRISSTLYPTRRRQNMCTGSGRTLLSPAQTLGRVPLTLAQTHTGLAAMGTSKASLRAKQTQWVYIDYYNIHSADTICFKVWYVLLFFFEMYYRSWMFFLSSFFVAVCHKSREVFGWESSKRAGLFSQH